MGIVMHNQGSIEIKHTCIDINIEEYLKNPLTCDCSHSPFQYNPSGHVITGDLNIILRKVISHGPKFREEIKHTCIYTPPPHTAPPSPTVLTSVSFVWGEAIKKYI
jgi:hypothetical protein